MVQKSRVTRSKRGMRRSHSALSSPAVAIDKTTGETHCFHHMTSSGYYRGRQVVLPKQPKLKENLDEEHSEE